MLTNNFSDSSFLSKDDAYQFMGTIKGTPAYWNSYWHSLQSSSNYQTVRSTKVFYDTYENTTAAFNFKFRVSRDLKRLYDYTSLPQIKSMTLRLS